MYQLVGYYKEPREEKSRLGFGSSKTVCDIDTQLYREGNSIPLRNFGVFKVEIPKNKTSEAGLRGVLEQRLRAIIKGGVEVGSVIIPPENIQIELELDKT